MVRIANSWNTTLLILVGLLIWSVSLAMFRTRVDKLIKLEPVHYVEKSRAP